MLTVLVGQKKIGKWGLGQRTAVIIGTQTSNNRNKENNMLIGRRGHDRIFRKNTVPQEKGRNFSVINYSRGTNPRQGIWEKTHIKAQHKNVHTYKH